MANAQASRRTRISNSPPFFFRNFDSKCGIKLKSFICSLLLGNASAFLVAGTNYGQAKPAADLIVTNAKVWTVDKAQPSAQAVAVLGDRILAVGSNDEVK